MTLIFILFSGSDFIKFDESFLITYPNIFLSPVGLVMKHKYLEGVQLEEFKEKLIFWQSYLGGDESGCSLGNLGVN